MAMMLEGEVLRPTPNGPQTGAFVAAGSTVSILETQGDWTKVKVANAAQDEGWAPTTSVDAEGANTGGPAGPLQPEIFADTCVLQGLIYDVNPHYIVGVAKLRSDLTDSNDGNRIGVFRLTAQQWTEVSDEYTANDINAWDMQCGGFASMVRKRKNAIGEGASPVQLYRAQWPDAPNDIDNQLKAAFDATADLEAAAEGRVLDPPAEPDADPPTEAGQFEGTPSNLPISARAYNLIISFEVSGEAVYNKRYRHPEWPGGRSGVTVGIGYDVGYCSAAQLTNDWTGKISVAAIASLQTVRGLKGTAARNALASVRNVDVPWAAAISVHQSTVIPRWVGIVTNALPNTGELSPDCLGALVSLTYNRGPSFSASGARYAEMRAIKQAMTSRNFAAIPDHIRDMKRLWPNVAGLLRRRDREAQLFQAGL